MTGIPMILSGCCREDDRCRTRSAHRMASAYRRGGVGDRFGSDWVKQLNPNWTWSARQLAPPNQIQFQYTPRPVAIQSEVRSGLQARGEPQRSATDLRL
ncbi:hypothetical protein [Parapedobacter pyrenivorans]|uniref:hypothetical protein n=1 Tax=Parapedobacter pyrenivorans TaxID=1305674 RepID=UPI001665F066|nr:hypothetical protein [Parapedobacter pyrenivorans]